MANCRSCSAPLNADTNICLYCGVRNDVDLHDKFDYTIKNWCSDHICPRCNIALQAIDLTINVHFYIERCSECFGIFFAPAQLEVLLDNAVSFKEAINLKHIQNINNDYYHPAKVTYIKCPVCQILMNRINFGYHSGVVTDQCRKHGIWLDSGEITHLIEWKKAGGQLLALKKQ